jgi:NAD(P)-dependent dehydrogenase (short-subunit alcohol dehydrogenase family)
MNLLDGKVALVTGSGRGLGRACAQLLARDGARVVVVDRNDDDGTETVRLIAECGGEAAFVHADVGKSADIQAMVRFAKERFGGLDCAVNNAVANLGRTPLAEIDDDVWDRGIAVNVTGVFLCMKYEIQAMLERGGGAIVNIGSGNEHSAVGGLSWYLPAKQMAYGMARCAAIDYGAQNIRVNSVGPGSMWTPGLRQSAAEIPQHVELLSARAQLKRLAEPEEVAEAVVWLCSSRSSYVTGHTLVADGGAVLG